MTRKVDPQDLHALLRYDPGSGKLWWRSRGGESPSPAEKQFNERYAGKEAFCTLAGSGYLVGSLLGTDYRAHRIIWALVYGEWPDFIDHENGKRSDNRIVNLRSATRTVNNRNKKRHRNNSSGCAGVHFHGGDRRWSANISVEGRQRHLGNFGTKAEAVAARKAAEVAEGYHPNHGRAA